MLNKKLLIASFVISASILFSGCSLVAQPANVESESPDVTITGTIIQAGTHFSLNVAGKTPVELDSRQITLSSYVNQNVTVTGQYSGTTLYVSEVQTNR